MLAGNIKSKKKKKPQEEIVTVRSRNNPLQKY